MKVYLTIQCNINHLRITFLKWLTQKNRKYSLYFSAHSTPTAVGNRSCDNENVCSATEFKQVGHGCSQESHTHTSKHPRTQVATRVYSVCVMHMNNTKPAYETQHVSSYAHSLCASLNIKRHLNNNGSVASPFATIGRISYKSTMSRHCSIISLVLLIDAGLSQIVVKLKPNRND